MGADEEPTADASATDVNDPEGPGPVTLEDRTRPGGAGSPDTNQGKTEPLSPEPDHPEPLAVPELADMNVGAGDPQAPSRPGAESTARAGSFGGGDAPGPDAPSQDTDDADGTAHRATGLQGSTPSGESLTDDVEAGATRMGAAPPDSVPGSSAGHGDAQGVPTSGSAPAPGTSENQPTVEGIRLPGSDDSPV